MRVSALVQVDGPPTPGVNFFSASIAAVAQGQEPSGVLAPEGVGELAISSDGNVYAYSGADLVPTFFTSAPVSLGEWHSLAVEANFATRQSSFFLDDVPLSGKSYDFDTRLTTNILLRGSMLTYCAQDSYFKKKDYSAQFDTFKIEVE